MSDADNKEPNRTPTPMFQSQSQSATGKADAAEKAAFKPASLLSSYQPDSPVFDEFLADNGQPRAHCAGLLTALQELGPAELKRRQETGERLVHEQGITYNVYGDPRGMERPCSSTRFHLSSRRTNGIRSKRV